MKNPFEKFTARQGPPTEAPFGALRTRAPVNRRNPFEEFRWYAPSSARRIPLDDLLAARDSALTALVEGYKTLVSEEADEGLWQPDGDSIVRIYARAQEIASGVPREAADIETFCLHALQNDDPDFFLMGPLGLYLSALCNTSDSPEIHLNLRGPELRIPLLGYRLAAGRRLTVEGDLNDLIGISLEGGMLEVEGSVGRYLGAGMTEGRIEIRGDAGRFIGEQMLGGQIHVHGRIGGTGKPRGGEIYHRKRRVYPPE